ncbi:AraC family transcriptional regulator [Vibrio palustris]|uniref:HTH-type transcriptional repressor of iron proteins A n=1 Tax=Vibrio palustris TaxID=1918946 RepID=A0A1R4B0W1_9VIBR|nr:AraC family transcriptional regulator [Vibrio palustris]SJL82552.1 HTH-type transcriptional repressor of iron proteins A [Vibrio palustris]
MQANALISASVNHQFVTKTIHMVSGYIEDFHAHPWHQIVFPLKGLLQSNIGDKCVVVPHNGMLYIPAHTVHKSTAITDTQFLAIYLNPDKVVQYGEKPKSCQVSAFIKELILLLFKSDTHALAPSHITSLLMVFRDQIELAHRYEIPLLIPADRRLLSIFVMLKQQPDLPLTLKQWAQKVGASERTLSRLCAKEFSQSFALWRQNIRLVLSLQLLDSAMTIQDIAIELGYGSDSAYVYAFKQLFNQTPSKYRTVNLKRGFMLGDLMAEQ